ncbi:MAG: CRTAC1 family protein [Bryobacter sp.]|nr:CRTAC1 family protein [Bryobacter sp.]
MRLLLLSLAFFAPANFEFPHKLDHAPTPEKHLPETMPGGIAVLDYDNDGRLDLFFTNAQGPCRLYRNVGDTRWQDATEGSGLITDGYTMGAAAADYDGDGRVDLFVTGLGANWLFRNLGQGKFQRVPFPPTGWSVSAAWLDYDLDGDLDLFIANYVQFNAAVEPYCGDRKAGYRTYCHPKHYRGLPNSLFRNDGLKSDGVKGFTDVTRAAGLTKHVGKGMGLAVADYDADGWPDVLVTNDAVPDFLFRNQRDGTFAEVGMEAGIGLNDDGRALSSMGADFRDLDEDGRPDIFITALANETFPLFRNLGQGLFEDITYPTRIGAATIAYSGWSTGIYDFDNDGRKDIFAANGDVNDNTEVFSSRRSRQQSLFLWNAGNGQFRAEAWGEAGRWRGAAFGDFNQDGAIDIALSRLGEAPVVWWNKRAGERAWLQMDVPLGTTARIGKQSNHATQAVGYASSSDAAIHFGLGEVETVPEVELAFPGGKRKVLKNVKARQRLRVEP